MSLSLPADPAHARSLTGVVPHILAALDGTDTWLRPARSGVICVIDGLGAANLAARAGHARALARIGGRRDVARTVFPATTAAALTSILTGTDPGAHGIVGYRVRVPETDDAPDQLRGWERYGLEPSSWQRSEPIMQREAARGRPVFVVSMRKYEGTGFSAATVRGAQFHGADDPGDRAGLAAQLAADHPGALVYLYFPELDGLGHRHGWESPQWTAALESVDGATQTLERALDPRTGVVITADHGMVDVPAHRHVLLRDGDGLTEAVRVIAGEPRMLHLHVEDGMAETVAGAWRASESHRSWVMTRAEAITAGLFGPVHPEVSARIGDVIVAARASIAYYDDRVADRSAQKMVGQHGSLTPAERIVPLLRLGAFA